MSEPGVIWNRAALESGGSSPREGDRALAALLLAHGLVMNGGVAHAAGVLSAEQLLAAISGYRFFGLGEVAETLRSARSGLSDESSEAADQRYWSVVPSDDSIASRFEAVFSSRPELFAPVEKSDER